MRRNRSHLKKSIKEKRNTKIKLIEISTIAPHIAAGAFCDLRHIVKFPTNLIGVSWKNVSLICYNTRKTKGKTYEYVRRLPMLWP